MSGDYIWLFEGEIQGCPQGSLVYAQLGLESGYQFVY